MHVTMQPFNKPTVLIVSRFLYLNLTKMKAKTNHLNKNLSLFVSYGGRKQLVVKEGKKKLMGKGFENINLVSVSMGANCFLGEKEKSKGT